jgi:hypothetical protein
MNERPRNAKARQDKGINLTPRAAQREANDQLSMCGSC